MVILVDDEDRENEGLGMAAELQHRMPSTSWHAMAVAHLSIFDGENDQLDLPMMVSDNSRALEQRFTSIEAATGVTTGISAADRARTIRVAVSEKAKPSDLSRPGHFSTGPELEVSLFEQVKQKGPLTLPACLDSSCRRNL